jgi:hypothetical protein
MGGEGPCHTFKSSLYSHGLYLRSTVRGWGANWAEDGFLDLSGVRGVEGVWFYDLLPSNFESEARIKSYHANRGIDDIQCNNDHNDDHNQHDRDTDEDSEFMSPDPVRKHRSSTISSTGTVPTSSPSFGSPSFGSPSFGSPTPSLIGSVISSMGR